MNLNLADWYCATFFGTDVADPYMGSGPFLDDAPSLFQLFMLDTGINQQKDGMISLKGEDQNQLQISNTVLLIKNKYFLNTVFGYKKILITKKEIPFKSSKYSL